MISLEVFLLENAVFTTRHCAIMIGRDPANTSRSLRRLTEQGALIHITRGVWAQPRHQNFTPYAAVPALLGNEHGYVSFLSAMHLHGLIAQIPGSIQIATTGHTRELISTIGRYEFFRLHPRMMRRGVEITTTQPAYGLANAEKSLLDTLYIRTRKGRRFAVLPELARESLDASTIYSLLDGQVPAVPVRRAIEEHLNALGLNRRSPALL